jgi:hypothetical protein
MSEVTEQQLEDVEALFVQTAEGMTSDRGTITLQACRRRRSTSPTVPSAGPGTCCLLSTPARVVISPLAGAVVRPARTASGQRMIPERYVCRLLT